MTKPTENIQSTLSTASPDVSIEEVNAQMMGLIDSDQPLKEALYKNNLLLKNQMNTILAWQENKQNLEKNAKGNISFLEKENADLHRRLSNLEVECRDLKKKSYKNCESVTLSLQKLQNDKKAAEKARDFLSNEISEVNNFHKNLREMLMVVNDQLGHLYRTGEHTDRQKEDLNNVLKCLRKKIEVLTEDFCSAAFTKGETGYAIGKKQEKIQTSDELNLQASIEIENLRKELEEKNKKIQTSDELILQVSTEMEILRKDLEGKNKELQTSEEMMLQTSTEAEKLTKELEEKNRKIQTSDELMLQVSTEMENLRKDLEGKNKELQTSEELIRQTSTETEKLRKELEEKNRKTEESILLRKNGVVHMEVDHLTARVMDLELRLEMKEEDMKKLIEELVCAKEDAEIIPILQAQIDIFKTDLEHAVSTRDSAHFEIENLEKELSRHRKEDSDSSGYYSTKKRSSKK